MMGVLYANNHCGDSRRAPVFTLKALNNTAPGSRFAHLGKRYLQVREARHLAVFCNPVRRRKPRNVSHLARSFLFIRVTLRKDIAQMRKLGAMNLGVDVRELQDILDTIKSGRLLSRDWIAIVDCDAILDARDANADFENNWLRLKEEVDRRWVDIRADRTLAQLAEEIRKQAFLAISEATRQHEIASYVSDDFDLIARGLAVKMSDTFLFQLLDCYRRNEIPTSVEAPGYDERYADVERLVNGEAGHRPGCDEPRNSH
jgi:hypothetical protein